MIERTLSILKPDAVKQGVVGQCLAMLEETGKLKIIAMQMTRFTEDQAAAFYIQHNARPFYDDLVTFMASGPVVVAVLEGENAVAMNRVVMGATEPSQRAAGTIRKRFSCHVMHNVVHGSDSVDAAEREIAFCIRECLVRLPETAHLQRFGGAV